MGVEQYVMVPADAVNQIGGNNPQLEPSTSQTVPEEQPKRRPGRPPRKEGSLTVTSKLIKSLGIALKIASLGAYTDKNEVVDANKKPVPHSNIVDLILHALTPGSNLIGEEEFIGWLKKADIDPSLVVNETIRHRLMYGTKEPPRREVRDPLPVKEPARTKVRDPSMVKEKVDKETQVKLPRQKPREPLPTREREEETQVEVATQNEPEPEPGFTNDDLSFAASQPLPETEDTEMGDQTQTGDRPEQNRRPMKRPPSQRPRSQYMVARKRSRVDDWDNNGNE